MMRYLKNSVFLLMVLTVILAGTACKSEKDDVSSEVSEVEIQESQDNQSVTLPAPVKEALAAQEIDEAEKHAMDSMEGMYGVWCSYAVYDGTQVQPVEDDAATYLAFVEDGSCTMTEYGTQTPISCAWEDGAMILYYNDTVLYGYCVGDDLYVMMPDQTVLLFAANGGQ